MTASLALKLEKVNGPAPALTGFVPKFAPCAWIAAGDAIAPGADESAKGMVEFGADNVITTVNASGVSYDLMLLNSAIDRAPGVAALWRLRLNTTAAASYGVPSVNLMFGFSFSVQTVRSA